MKRQFGFPEQQLEAMIPVFIKTLYEHQVELEKAVTSGNLEHIGRAAHTIKGALLNLGLSDCARTAFSIERDAKAALTHTDYQALVENLKSGFKDLFDESNA